MVTLAFLSFSSIDHQYVMLKKSRRNAVANHIQLQTVHTKTTLIAKIDTKHQSENN